MFAKSSLIGSFFLKAPPTEEILPSSPFLRSASSPRSGSPVFSPPFHKNVPFLVPIDLLAKYTIHVARPRAQFQNNVISTILSADLQRYRLAVFPSSLM